MGCDRLRSIRVDGRECFFSATGCAGTAEVGGAGARGFRDGRWFGGEDAAGRPRHCGGTDFGRVDLGHD